MARNLTTTAIVTILALFVQVGLFYYLNHGGWQMLDNLLNKF